MPNSNMRTIRGLSIAVLVLSILAILGTIVVAMLLALTVAVLPEAVDAAWEHSFTDEELYEFYELGLNKDNVTAISQSMMGIAGVLLVLIAACCVVCLIASVLGLKNYHKPEKLGLVFGWSVAGAICAFCTTQIISLVLLVVMAVMINKVRNEARLNAAYAQQPMPYAPYDQPQNLSAPYAPYGQPQAPYAAPAPAAPYAQPQTPAAPAAPTAQTAPSAASPAQTESVASPCEQTAASSDQAQEQPGANQNS